MMLLLFRECSAMVAALGSGGTAPVKMQVFDNDGQEVPIDEADPPVRTAVRTLLAEVHGDSRGREDAHRDRARQRRARGDGHADGAGAAVDHPPVGRMHEPRSAGRRTGSRPPCPDLTFPHFRWLDSKSPTAHCQVALPTSIDPRDTGVSDAPVASLLTIAAAVATATVASIAISAVRQRRAGRSASTWRSATPSPRSARWTTIHGEPIGCARATDNYPSGWPSRLGVGSFVDVTCGGAETVHMTQPQSGDRRRQRAAVRRADPGHEPGDAHHQRQRHRLHRHREDVRGEELLQPVRLAVQGPLHRGRHRRARRADQRRRRPVDAALDGIHERAPQATVVLVGYLRILPPSDGCWPVVPFARGDVPYFDGVQHQLNAMLGAQAAANGAVFVNPGDVLGHDVCSDDKWVEGLIPESLSVPLHPNAAGQAFVADMIAEALG